MRVPKGGNGKSGGEAQKLSLDKLEEIFHIKNASQGDIPFSGPLTSGFAWAKRRNDNASIRSHSRSISRGHSNRLEPSSALQQKNNSDTKGHDNGDLTYGVRTNSRGHDSYEISKVALRKQWRQFEHPDSFDASEEYHSQELSLALYQREGMEARGSNLVRL